MRVTVDIEDRDAMNKARGFQVFKAQIKLSQVTRDAKLRIKFIAPVLSSDLVKNFKNGSISINLVNAAKEKVNFTIENRDTLKGEV